MFDRVKESISRKVRRLSRASNSGLRSSSRDSPSSSQYSENGPRQSDAPEFPQHPGVNPIANKPLPHRPNIESQQDSFSQNLLQHPVFNARHSDVEPRSPVSDSSRRSITGHRKHPSNGGHDEAMSSNELSQDPTLKPLGSDVAPRNEPSRHSRSSAAISQHERDNSRKSPERNNPRSSSDVQRHAINQQYVPRRSGSRHRSQSSQDQQFNAPPLDESLKKPLPLEPIRAGETPMEFSNRQPVFPEPLSRKAVAVKPTPETTQSGRNLDGHCATSTARGGSVPGVESHEKHTVPPPIEVSAEILKHVDTALPNMTFNAEGSSLSSDQEIKSIDNEQHYKLVNEDKFQATAKITVATVNPDGSTDYRDPGVADFDSAKPHKKIYFDHEVHERNAVVHEEIKPHVHTIYEPKRTRSIHYHEHRQVIQPISDPEPIVKPAQHWAEDHRTGEIFKIPDGLGEQLLENAYDEFKRIDGCNIYGNDVALAGGFQELNLGGRGDGSTESNALSQNYVSPKGHTDHRIHNNGAFDKTRQPAGSSQHNQAGDRSNIQSVLGQSTFREYGQNTQQREFTNRDNLSSGLGNSHDSNQKSRILQQRDFEGRRDIVQDLNKSNLNDQAHPSSTQATTSQQRPLQQQSGQEKGTTSVERSHNPQGRRPSLPADPLQTSPPLRDWRIQRPSLEFLMSN